MTALKACILIVAAFLPAFAPAANLIWDANTAITGTQDGSGTWDNSANNWWTGAANTTFNNATPDAPTFGSLNGAAGTVTLGANIISGNVTFNAPSVGNYTIAGGGFTLTLTNRTVTANVNATISANIVPSGAAISSLTLANNAGAVLTLSGNNSFTNFNLGTSVNSTAAAVRIGSSTAFGWGNVGVAGGQGSSTSHRIELVANGLSITNIIANLGRNNNSAVVVNLGTANVMSGTQTKTTGGTDAHWASEVANGLTFSGASGGGIALSSSAASPRYFVFRGSGGGTVSGIISTGTGGLGITKTGIGTWTLSGGPNTQAVGTIVDQGTLVLDYSTQNNTKWAATSPLTLAGGTLTLTGGSFIQTNASTSIIAGNSFIARSSGSSTLRLNAVTRNRGGVIDFGAVSIADLDNPNVNGILGGYATVAGADWAMNSTGAGDGPVTAYTAYTSLSVNGPIADSSISNVRLNNAGGAASYTLGAATTSINTLQHGVITPATVDTSAGILRLGAIGGVLESPVGGGLTIGTAANSGTLTAGGAAGTAGEIVLINNSANDILINSVVADNGAPVSLTKAGSGTATLAGSNTHTGTNSIVGGTLNVSDDSNFGAVPGAATGGSILLNGGVLNATASFTLNAYRGMVLGPTSRYGNGTISVANGQTLAYSGIIANADTTGSGPGGSLTKTGNGILILGGANTYANGTIINAGTVRITASGNLGTQPGCYIPDHVVVNGGTLEAAGSLTLGVNRGIQLGPIGGSGDGTFQADDGVTLQLDSRISDNWNGTGSLIKTGNGTLLLTGGVNDYSGDTTINAGVLQINNARSIPNGPGTGNLLVNGTLNINGVSAGINGLSGNGTVDNISGTAMTFSVGNNDQGGVFGGVIQNSGGGALALSKTGAGTLTLSGASAYSGGTIINNGVLALSGSGSIYSSTNIAVGATGTLNVTGLGGGLTLVSGQTLSGTGTVLGTIVDGGGASVAPGASAGTLNIANLSLAGGGLNYELASVTNTGAGLNDFIAVSGNLDISASTTLNIVYLNAVPASTGKYTLISYGTFSGDVTNINVPSGFTINNNTTDKTIELLINHVPTTLTWIGDGAANVWDINLSPNWTGGATFFNGDTANFDNTGSATPAISVAAPVTAAAVNVSGTQDYDFTGSAVSSTLLTKTGAGMLTLENDNNFAAGAILNGGNVQIGNGGLTGSLTGGHLTNNTALVVNRIGDVSFTNSISGSGSISQINSDGTTALSGSNSYSGGTFVTAGRVYARNGSAFGDLSSGTTVSADAQIYIDQNVNFIAEPLTLNGNGLNGAGDGALRKGGAGVTIFGGPVALGSDSTIRVDQNATLNLTNAAGITSAGPANLFLTGGSNSLGTISGPINLGGGGGVLTKTGSGAWTLGGSNAMRLAPITDGTLILASNDALGTNENIVLASTTGGAGLSGTRLTLSGGLSIPANRSLTMPSSTTTRSAFFGTGAGVTNTWAGLITLVGDFSSSDTIGFGAENNSTLLISGNVTADASFPGKVFLRGNGAGTGNTGAGILTGTLTLDGTNGQVQFDDGTTWILGSGGNTWALTIFANNSGVILSANNALPTASVLSLAANAPSGRFDLNGFNQLVPALGTGPGLNITNSSRGADSTLTYSSTGSSVYGGTIKDGTQKLNLAIATGNLTLTNAVTLSLAKSTVSVAGGGAVLKLDFIGTNTVNALVLNGVGQSAGYYSSLEASPYLAGTGYLLVQPVPASPVTLTNTVNGSTLTLSWPAGLGWRLQAQTNSISTGLTTNWTYITDGSVSSANITIYQTNPSVFFRLRNP